MNEPICHDTEKLFPSFREAVLNGVIPDMEALGWDPICWETLRTKKRGLYLKQTGKSKNGNKSVHCYMNHRGEVGAVDIISKKYHWFSLDKETRKLGVRFFKDLHACYVKHGITVISWDGPHGQFLKVSEQNRFRAMTPEQRTAFMDAWADPTTRNLLHPGS